jgi:carbon monoxide dehydrogenase subunit G
MQAVEKFITTAHPDAIWRILADVEHWPDWTPTVVEVKPLGNAGLTVGAHYRVTQPKLRPAVYEVIECTPNKAFVWVRRFPGGTMIADHRLVPRSGGTEVELSFVPRGILAAIISTIFSRLIQEYVRAEARSLQRQCESL